MRLRPLEAFLQLLLGLLHELERLRAMAVVVVGRLLELLLGALEVARGGLDVGMATGTRGSLARRGGRRRRGLRADGRGGEERGQRHPGYPELSSHGMYLRHDDIVSSPRAACSAKARDWPEV